MCSCSSTLVTNLMMCCKLEFLDLILFMLRLLLVLVRIELLKCFGCDLFQKGDDFGCVVG